MKTKFGNAKISNNGYYVITSKKEGNQNKLLHRLIWEDFYNCEVPEGYIIHHKNEDKLDNCILNLQVMRDKDHRILHNTGENHPFFGKHLSNEHKQKLSKANSGENNPMYGKTHSEESKNKMSESHKGMIYSEESMIQMSKGKNSSGYFRVSKQNCKKCKEGFTWAYQYYENGKRKIINSVSIDKLEKKVTAKGLKWRKL